MKRYLFLLLLFSNTCLYSQSYDNAPFSPSGAMWLYDALAWGSTDHHIIKYVSDTVISGRDVKKMKYFINHYTYQGPNHDIIVKTVEQLGNLYYSSNGDTLFYVDRNDWSFQPLYNESLALHDSFYVQQNEFYICSENPITGNYTKLVDSPDLNINSTLFKTQIFESNGPWRFGWNDQVIKNIGGKDFPFPFYDFETCSNMLDFWTGYNFMGLRCYYDDVRGYIKFGGSTPCDIAFYTFSNEEFSGTLNLSIFPNPTSDYVEITGLNTVDFEKASVQIFDLEGRSYQTNRDGNRIDVTNLKSGVYTILVTYKNMRKQLKIVKI